MKPIIGLVFLCLLFANSYAQNFSVKGKIADTLSKANFQKSTIAFLNAADSTLYGFTHAGDGGYFSAELEKGSFIMLISYPGYADFIEPFVLDSNKRVIDFKLIQMSLTSRLLQEVVVKASKAQITIKGDTIEYHAGNFKVQPNATVEDLLKQLPGLEVDKNGKISAQGQTVSKILVDGEEFFSDDPTLVTQNLRADIVDKVQVFDRKSDQSAFTGIDDGKKSKTINIKLKEDKKNGQFGKLDAGLGTSKYYQSQVLYNKFNDNTKLSAYGTSSNTSLTGLGGDDSNKYGVSGDNVELLDDGGIIVYQSGRDDLDSFNGKYTGIGIPTASTGGLHYNNKWDTLKQSININYKIGYLTVKGSENQLEQNTLPVEILKTNTDHLFDNSIFRQKLDMTYQLQIDSTSNLKISFNGTEKNDETNNSYNTTTQKNVDTLLNQQIRQITNKGTEQNVNFSAFYSKKFKKVGRTLSIKINEINDRTDHQGYLNSKLTFYNANGQIDSMQAVDQYKTTVLSSNILGSNIAYSEPLMKSLSVIVSYGFIFNTNAADRRSFDQSGGGQYSILDPGFSNDYKLNQTMNIIGAVINYKKGKSIINFGTKVNRDSYTQHDLYTGEQLKKQYVNWNTLASYQYRVSNEGSIQINYKGVATEPAIDQIQPIKVNTDPLNIIIGNPFLTPSFSNKFDANFNYLKFSSRISLFIGGTYSLTSNAIINSSFTDLLGKSTYKFVNFSGETPVNSSFYLIFNKNIAKPNINMGFSIYSNGNTFYSFSNNAENKIKSYSYSGTVNLSKHQQQKYDLSLSFGPSYTVSKSSLQDITNNGAGFTANSSAVVHFPGKVEIAADENYTYQAKTESFNQDFERLIINASISKLLLSKDNLRIKISGNDLLNQNSGFNRTATSTLLIQNSYSTIKRYFMLSVIYNFNKMGK